jgi:hypothetical protein
VEDDYLDKPLDVVQSDFSVLDALKGIEAFSEMILRTVNHKFEEYPLDVGAFADDEDEDADVEPIDDLHHFIREVNRCAAGARQQLEQRLFGKKT